MSRRRAVVIQHVAFEDLGTLEPALEGAGYSIELRQAGVDDLPPLAEQRPELLIVLGGPIGVYEDAVYPFLRDEIALLARRVEQRLPTLGICLGAQLIAAALGARVMPGGQGKEIGWGPLTPAPAAVNPLAPLFEPGLEVLHWHGDTFALPREAVLLASTRQYAHQAFSIGEHTLALQCHPEVRAGQLERWYIGHAAELAAAGISVPELRAHGLRQGPALERAASALWRAWLSGLANGDG